MQKWFVIHDYESYEQHPDKIGCSIGDNGKLIDPSFKKLQKGDQVVYYAKGDSVIVGIFEVTSNNSIWKMGQDKYWGKERPIMVYSIKPVTLPGNSKVLDFRKLLTSGTKLDFIPNITNWGIRLRGRTVINLSDKDFETITDALKRERYETQLGTKTITERLGEAFPAIDLLYEPIDEMGVVFLFSKFHRKIGFPFIVRIKERFPDVIAIDDKGERKLIELQYRSSDFKRDKHDPKECDVVVCWIDDWDDKPKDLAVISLRDELGRILGLE